MAFVPLMMGILLVAFNKQMANWHESVINFLIKYENYHKKFWRIVYVVIGLLLISWALWGNVNFLNEIESSK